MIEDNENMEVDYALRLKTEIKMRGVSLGLSSDYDDILKLRMFPVYCSLL